MPSISMGVQRRLSQASVGLVIAGLHVGGVLVWWGNGRDMKLATSPERLPTIAVWLPAPPKPDAAQAQRLARTQVATGPSRLRDAHQPAPVAPPNPFDNAKQEAQNTLAEQAAPAATPPLNLTLTRKDIASVAPPSFAERSPFHGRLPMTVERQIASVAAQSGPWTEERIDNDNLRLRRGNTCIMMQRPRAASIDPFNEASGRLPWRASYQDCSD